MDIEKIKYADLLKSYLKFLKKSPPLLLLIGVVFFGMASMEGIDTNTFITGANPIPGKVINLIKNTNAEGHITYAPEIEYNLNEKKISFISSSASNPSRYSIGETIELLSNSNTTDKIKLNGFWELWGITLVYSIFSFTTFLCGLILSLKIVKEKIDAKIKSI